MLTRGQVEQMLAAREAIWQNQIQQLSQAFAAALKAIPHPTTEPRPDGWRFKPTYDRSGKLDEIITTPIRKAAS
jgi:hypothetical protein